MITTQQVADSIGASTARVNKYWPLIVDALIRAGIDSPAVEQAVIATVGTEVPNLALVAEYGGPGDFNNREPGTKLGDALGNTAIGDGYRYRGRGWLQLTGRGNYRAAGAAVGQPLENSPEMALDAPVAADVLAWYFRTRGVAAAAERGDWRAVRRLVNGGYNGWDRFTAVLGKLGIDASGTTAGGVGIGLLALGGLAWVAFRR